MTTTFDRDTGIEELEPGVFGGHIDKRWWIVRGPNGGHLAAILLRAMLATVDDPGRSPRSLTVHFTRPPVEGSHRVEVTVEREGRSLSTVSARMIQEDKLVALALCAFSVPRRRHSQVGGLTTPGTQIEFVDLSMPEVAAPEGVDPRPDRGDMPFLSNFDFRWVVGVPEVDAGDRAESGAWMRLREPRMLDDVLCAQFMDAWAPAVFARDITPQTGVPTIDLTIHFREPLPLPDARPEDWYLGLFRTTVARQGFIEEDGWLWSRDGRLIAQSRQLALLLGA